MEKKASTMETFPPTSYQHRFLSNSLTIEPGKAVCVGRNYREHAKELGNPVPTKPIFFMKPKTSFVSLEQGIVLPDHGKVCHHEIELAVLIGFPLKRAMPEDVKNSIIGYGLALDLTLRDVQDELKSKGHPWEISKAFDGACPLSPFVNPQEFPYPQNINFELAINGKIRQNGNSKDMIFGIFDLISQMSQYFTLERGDVILTGTPSGVNALKPGDELALKLDNRFEFTTKIYSSNSSPA